MVLAMVILYAGLTAMSNAKAADKAFTYTYPYLILAVVIGVTTIVEAFAGGGRFRPLIVQSTKALVASWLALAVILGLFLPFQSQPQDYFARSVKVKGSNSYDISHLLPALQTANSELLVVNVPSDTGWEYPFYLMLVLTPYRTYYQSGLVIDNSTGFRNFLLAVPDRAPDYVLTNTPADYVAGTSFGELIAQDPGLRLYRLQNGAQPWVAERLAQSRSEQEAKPPFPTLAEGPRDDLGRYRAHKPDDFGRGSRL